MTPPPLSAIISATCSVVHPWSLFASSLLIARATFAGSLGGLPLLGLSFDLGASYAGRMMEGKNYPMDQFVWPPGNENRIGFTVREPLGVVLAITPFNFPAAAFAQKVVPALLAGNTVVVKPSLLAPLTMWHLTKILLESGFPPGTVNFVTGKSSEIGDLLVDHPHVSAVTFTGSSEVGLSISARAMSQGKRVLMVVRENL